MALCPTEPEGMKCLKYSLLLHHNVRWRERGRGGGGGCRWRERERLWHCSRTGADSDCNKIYSYWLEIL